MIVDTALREREAAGHPIRVGMIGSKSTSFAAEVNADGWL